MQPAPITGLEIAVIGMAGRFPGARNIAQFWDGLMAGRESISFFTPEEMRSAGIDESLIARADYVPARGVLGNAARFDASFFGYSPKEASLIDPQQRHFLEIAWNALEDAGHAGRGFPGRIGVYAAVAFNSYLVMRLQLDPGLLHGEDGALAMLANDKDFLATRVSYKLNLTGPSVVVQSACSSSLVAMHQACHSLLAGEADLQIAGGVSIRVPEPSGYLYREGMINSADGRCRPFDRDAAGTVAGNGVGCVVLRRLEDALSERDHIYAVIRASAINNDGDDKVGYAAPSVGGQTRVIRSALAIAEIPAHTVGLVETHGSGTRMGDPIEVEALRSAYGSEGWNGQRCALGAVKANIGHLDAAAGIVGFIKAVLALHHRQIPPHPNFREANPLCGLTDGPFYVNREPVDWADPGHPRRAAVSSFGMGGTNAHVVLEQAPDPLPTDPEPGWQLVPLSAKTLRALDQRKDDLRADLVRLADTPLADIAYTLQTGRSHFQHSYFLLARSTGEAAQTLSTGFNRLSVGALWDGVERQATFLFPGQGAQFPGMGRTLYVREPLFRAEVDACARAVEDRCGWSLTELLFDTSEAAEERLRQTRFTQPALFAVELALARLFIAWGIQPEALMGHSVGEYVAATLAGVMEREAAAVLVAERGRLIDRLPPGEMLLVPLGEGPLGAFLDGEVDLAVQNTPNTSVFSGSAEGIAALEARLTVAGIATRRLHTSHAFHSRLMEPILTEMQSLAGRIALRAPAIPMISNRTGTWLGADQATDPAYWAGHLRDPVRFYQGIETLAGSVPRLFLELGPGSSLARYCRETLDAPERYRIVSALPRPHEDQDAQSTALLALGQLWQEGLAVQWRALHSARARNRLSLAGYPFHGGDYWVSVPGQEGERASESRPNDLLRTRVWCQRPPSAPAVADMEHILVLQAGMMPLRWLRRGLLSKVAKVTNAVPGSAFARRRNGDFRLRQGAEEDYLRLLETVHTDPQRPLDVLAIFPPPGAGERLGKFLSLIKALARHTATWDARLRLTLVLPTSYEVLGTEPESWETQGAAALVEMLGGLAPGISWRILDAGELYRGPRFWLRGRIDRAWTARAAPLLADLSGFEPGTLTAYRNGRRWRMQEAPMHPPEADGAAAGSLADASYLITGELNPWAVDLLRRWQRRWGGHYVYLLPPAATLTEAAAASCRQTAEVLRDEGMALTLVRSEALQFMLPNLRRRAGGRPVHLWYLNALPPAEADEVLMYLDPEDLGAITSGTLRMLSALHSIQVDSRVWISTLPAYYRHPPHALQVLSEAPVSAACQRGDWRVLHLGEDLFDTADSGPWAGVDEDRRMELLAQAMQAPPALGGLLLCAQAPRAAAWSGRRTPGAATPQAEGAAEGPGTNYARPDLPIPYAAPITDRQKTICVIWQDLFQIDRIGIHDNFFDLGGDSVMALRLLSALESYFKVELPLAEVMNAPTVAEQANSVVEYTETALEARRPSPVVGLRKDGSHPPFFCVHPAGGLVHCYVEMARDLGREQPFYAFQHPGLDGKTGPYKTYPKMAELYIEAMRQIQPQGPYWIGGWSFGGTAAFEMACQLRAAGEEVGLLALFDSPGPSALYRLQGRPEFELAGMMAFLSQALARMFGGEIALDIEEFVSIPRDQQMNYLVERMVSVTGQDEMVNARDALERVIDIFELTDRAEQIYTPPRYSGRVHMYRVQEVSDYEYTAYKNHPQIGRADFGWGQICDDLVVRFVPGSHMNMIFPPNIEVLAGKLSDDLHTRRQELETLAVAKSGEGN